MTISNTCPSVKSNAAKCNKCRYNELCEKYGSPEAVKAAIKAGTEKLN